MHDKGSRGSNMRLIFYAPPFMSGRKPLLYKVNIENQNKGSSIYEREENEYKWENYLYFQSFKILSCKKSYKVCFCYHEFSFSSFYDKISYK